MCSSAKPDRSKAPRNQTFRKSCKKPKKELFQLSGFVKLRETEQSEKFLTSWALSELSNFTKFSEWPDFAQLHEVPRSRTVLHIIVGVFRTTQLHIRTTHLYKFFRIVQLRTAPRSQTAKPDRSKAPRNQTVRKSCTKPKKELFNCLVSRSCAKPDCSESFVKLDDLESADDIRNFSNGPASRRFQNRQAPHNFSKKLMISSGFSVSV